MPLKWIILPSCKSFKVSTCGYSCIIRRYRYGKASLISLRYVYRVPEHFNNSILPVTVHQFKMYVRHTGIIFLLIRHVTKQFLLQIYACIIYIIQQKNCLDKPEVLKRIGHHTAGFEYTKEIKLQNELARPSATLLSSRIESLWCKKKKHYIMVPQSWIPKR